MKRQERTGTEETDRTRQRETPMMCKSDIICPTCQIEMHPEHAHYKCPQCHYRDSCCF